MRKKIYTIFLGILLLPSSALALTPLEGLKQAGSGTGLIMDQTPAGMVALVINALLGLLGTAFVVYIILGGFRWMTSAGNAERIEGAKKTIINATIGLVIVIGSYIIVNFIISTLQGATSGSGSGGVEVI